LTDFDFSDILSIAQTIGIIGSLVMMFYFSRREIRHMGREYQTQILSEITEKLHRIGEIIIDHPELAKVINQVDPPEQVFAVYILSTYNQAYQMHKRKLLSDTIWAGWVQIIKNSFRDGTVKGYWKKIDENCRFSNEFRDFINKKILTDLT